MKTIVLAVVLQTGNYLKNPLAASENSSSPVLETVYNWCLITIPIIIAVAVIHQIHTFLKIRSEFRTTNDSVAYEASVKKVWLGFKNIALGISFIIAGHLFLTFGLKLIQTGNLGTATFLGLALLAFEIYMTVRLTKTGKLLFI